MSKQTFPSPEHWKAFGQVTVSSDAAIRSLAFCREEGRGYPVTGGRDSHVSCDHTRTANQNLGGAMINKPQLDAEVREPKYGSEKKSHLSVSSALLTHDCALVGKR